MNHPGHVPERLMTEQQYEQLLVTLKGFTVAVNRLTYQLGACSDKELLRDEEAATLLGHLEPEAATRWLEELAAGGQIVKQRIGKYRRWSRQSIEQFLRTTGQADEAPTRKQRTRRIPLEQPQV